jgi:hypothetical protein
MFERYTEKARRVIFFARYEASQFGSPDIETEHLVLGLLREDKALTNRFPGFIQRRNARKEKICAFSGNNILRTASHPTWSAAKTSRRR